MKCTERLHISRQLETGNLTQCIFVGMEVCTSKCVLEKHQASSLQYPLTLCCCQTALLQPEGRDDPRDLLQEAGKAVLWVVSYSR